MLFYHTACGIVKMCGIRRQAQKRPLRAVEWQCESAPTQGGGGRKTGRVSDPPRAIQYLLSVVMAGVRRNMARPTGMRITVAQRA
jgi:hypothetical protein